MNDLRSRAEAFLRSPCIISEPGASLLGLIARYAEGKPWDDPELGNLLLHGIGTAQREAARRKEATAGPACDGRIFYQEAAALLQEIQAEVSAVGKAGTVPWEGCHP
jgi:hypothetical protein